MEFIWSVQAWQNHSTVVRIGYLNQRCKELYACTIRLLYELFIPRSWKYSDQFSFVLNKVGYLGHMISSAKVLISIISSQFYPFWFSINYLCLDRTCSDRFVAKYRMDNRCKTSGERVWISETFPFPSQQFLGGMPRLDWDFRSAWFGMSHENKPSMMGPLVRDMFLPAIFALLLSTALAKDDVDCLAASYGLSGTCLSVDYCEGWYVSNNNCPMNTDTPTQI